MGINDLEKVCLLFTGSREVTIDRLDYTYPYVRLMPERWIRDVEEVIVIHGGAKGLDSLAVPHIVADGFNCEVKVEVMKPKWVKLGKAAGSVRNQEMVDRAVELQMQGYRVFVLAFPMRDREEDLMLPPHKREHSRGTYDCMAKARMARLQVVETQVDW